MSSDLAKLARPLIAAGASFRVASAAIPEGPVALVARSLGAALEGTAEVITVYSGAGAWTQPVGAALTRELRAVLEELPGVTAKQAARISDGVDAAVDVVIGWLA